jgi:hypothetical protein
MTAAMTAAGAAATVVTARRGDPPAIPVALGYFAVMEGLQLGGYATLGLCGTPANEAVTFLSILHIAFQPFVINAFAMALIGGHVSARVQALVFTLCALSSAVILMQLHPFEWAGACQPGETLCGPTLCTVPGDWHIAWDVPYNGLLVPIDRWLGWGFPTYVIAAFGLPLLYGAWRFVVLHALTGPTLAGLLTSNPNEVPAIWCLFSIMILLLSLFPALRRSFATQPAAIA